MGGYITSMSSSTGKGLEQRGVWDVGGVDGGEGNRMGRMGGDKGASRMVGDKGGKNTTGWMGETGEGETCFKAGLLGELGEMELRSGLGGDDVQEWDVGDVAFVNPAGGTGGVVVSSDTHGAGEGVFVLGCKISAEGEPTGAGGGKSTWSEGEGQEKAAITVGDAPEAGFWTSVCLVGDFSHEAAGTVGTDGAS